MDRTGKDIRTCDIKTCIAPFRQKPVKIRNALDICKYCVKANEKQEDQTNEILREFEIEEHQKKFTPELKQVSKMFSKEEQEREELRLKRKEASKHAKKKKPVKRLKTKNYAKDESKQKEYAALKEYWDMRADEDGACLCEESGVYIPFFDIGNVHHILPKGALPQAKFDLENMCVLSAEKHTLAHAQQHKMKLHEYFEEVKLKMKRRYSMFDDLDILENQNKVA